jgi:restriction system protein
MALPDFQSFMLPILSLAHDGREHSLAEARRVLAEQLSLVSKSEANPFRAGGSGGSTIASRWRGCIWSKRDYFPHRDALTSVLPTGVGSFSPKGRRVLAYRSLSATRSFGSLGTRPDGQFRTGQARPPPERTAARPEGLLEQAHQRIHAELVSDILDRLRSSSPIFFDNLIIELLFKMG